MSNLNKEFHPKVTNWALKTYDLLRSLFKGLPEEQRSNLMPCLQIYLEVKDSHREGIESELRKIARSVDDRNFSIDRIHAQIEGVLSTTPLKSINMIVLNALHSGNYDKEKLDTSMDKMTSKRNLSYSNRTNLDFTEDAIEEFEVEKNLLSLEEIDLIDRRLTQWMTQVHYQGIRETSEDAQWGDKQIGTRYRDDRWKCRRSVKLSYRARVIYRVDTKREDDYVVSNVWVERLTGLHNYKP